MKTFLSISLLTTLLCACSIDIVSTTPTIEEVPLNKQSQLHGISCIVEGSYPHIGSLDSKQVEVNINSKIDAYVHELEMENARCPKDLLGLTIDGAMLTDTTTVDYEVTMLQNSIYSVKIVSSQYFEGAAHPSNSIKTFTFSLIDGQPITLKMLFPDIENIPAFLTEQIQQALIDEGMDETYPSETSNEVVKFYLTPDAVILTDLFSVHAMQGLEVAIPVTLPST